MIALLQRVSEARVDVDGHTVGAIGRGILALIGVEAGDTVSSAERLAERMLTYRIFPDNQGKMNLDIGEIGGDLLIVPQFTLAADTSKGNRPGFQTAAPPDAAQVLFETLLARARTLHGRVETGVFGASMQVSLVNDGPVTFSLRVPSTI
ncbi:MAG: D-aminoacyl-tRNA deacylase [Pseudomonadota bacterium]|jgi:D-tyrosyl-tRNA(Tyr) deacylase